MFLGTLLYGDSSSLRNFTEHYGDSSLWRLFFFPGTGETLPLYGTVRNFTGTLFYGYFSSFPGPFSMETRPLYGTDSFSMKTLPLYGTLRNFTGDSSLWRSFLFPGTLLYGVSSSSRNFTGTFLSENFFSFPGLFSVETFLFTEFYGDSSLWRLFFFPGTLLYGDCSSLRNFMELYRDSSL